MAVTRSQMRSLLRDLEPQVRRAFERAIKATKGRANIARLEKAIIAGDLDAVMEAAGVREGMWSGLTEEVRTAYKEAGVFVMAADIPKRVGLEFNINNPRAESWLRNNSAQKITGDLVPRQVKAIQVVLQNGMEQGLNPRATALDIVGRISKVKGRRVGGILGLTEQQAQYAVNMRNVLLTDPRQYFIKDRITGAMKGRYVLRDKRFDAVVKKYIAAGEPLPLPVANQIVGRYKDRLLKHRGDTIARTETLRALNAANDEALVQAVGAGLAPADAVTRVWRHSFQANERPGHKMMSGQERGLYEPFTNPLTGEALRYPGDEDAPADETINCRCYVEHRIDFVAVERAKMAGEAAKTNNYNVNLSIDGAPSDKTEDILASLRTMPGAEERVNKIAAIIENNGWGTVFAENLDSAYEHANEIWEWSNSALGKFVPQITRRFGAHTDSTGLTHPMWSFMIVQSENSIVDNFDWLMPDVRNAVSRGLRYSAYRPFTLTSNEVGIYAHELGHLIHASVDTSEYQGYIEKLSKVGKTGLDWKGVSEYSETNDDEYIAESFAAWLLNYDDLKANRPRVAAEIDRLVNDAYSYVEPEP